MRKTRKAYTLPDVIVPEGYRCTRVFLPNDPHYFGVFWASFEHLAKWTAWEENDTQNAKLAAEVWREGFNLSREAWLDNEDCFMNFELRQNPSNPCQLQQSTDGGETWTLAFDYNLCNPPITLPAPYPGSDTGDDDAAAELMRDIWIEILNIVDDSPDKPTFIGNATTAMRLYDPTFTNPAALGDVWDIYMSMTITEREEYNSECTFVEKKDELATCISVEGLIDWLGCASDVLAGWLNEASDALMLALDQVAASMTPNSWQAAAGGGAGGGAGFGAGCGDSWVQEWDFLLSNGGWSTEPNAIGQTTAATWVSGAGWKVAAHSGTLNFVSIKAPATASSYVAQFMEITVFSSGASSRYAALLDLSGGVQTELVGGAPPTGEYEFLNPIETTVNRLMAYLRTNGTLDGFITKVVVGGNGTNPY